VYAAGISSISQLHAAYSQNTKNINNYIESLTVGKLPVEKGYLLNEQEIIIREVVNELMCNFYLDIDKLAVGLGIETAEVIRATGFKEDEITNFEKDGLLSISMNTLDIEDSGKFFIRNIAAAFDPLQKVESGRRFSRTV
jgi:oxygen-independent coproporphyrinogen-3 oxidase